jgi:hypothetical protein
MIDSLYVITQETSIWEEIIPNWITAVSALVGLAALLLAFKLFVKQKKWEKKSELYFEIIDKMHIIKINIDSFVNISSKKYEDIHEELERLDEIITANFRLLEKYRDIGIFVLDEKAINCINGYFEAVNYQPLGLRFAHDVKDLKITEDYKNEIIEIGKKDLSFG